MKDEVICAWDTQTIKLDESKSCLEIETESHMTDGSIEEGYCMISLTEKMITYLENLLQEAKKARK